VPEPGSGGADKVFGIGFYKTGTTTLCDALRVLGYRTVNGDKLGEYPGADDGETLLKQIRAGDLRLPTFAMFDAFTDNPYFHLWREIHTLYPRAKFLLTVREERPWIDSCARFYRNRRVRPMRVWMFGAWPHRAASQGLARGLPRTQRGRACALRDPAAGSLLRVRPHARARLGTALRLPRSAGARAALAARKPHPR
jgi:hypothetical protein